ITAFLSNRRVIILDEPTSGLDYKNMEIMAKLINEYSKKISIVIITHDLEFLFKCCNSVLLIKDYTYDKVSLIYNEDVIFNFLFIR
ncbi:AAA family ATPase, partial [Peptoniphilus rhinitidis]|uniref:AAA family ATPase n=1 Tax=Peptoniphilus rhinitidis TaxID=1175452 RepID=UPI0029064E80